MKTHLIVLTSLDELRAKKNEMVQKFDEDGNLKKYGDDSVETNDDNIFFFKVITLSEYRTKLLQQIGRGYDHVYLGSVVDEINMLLNTISEKGSEEIINNDNIPEKNITPAPEIKPEFPAANNDDNDEDENHLDDEQLLDRKMNG